MNSLKSILVSLVIILGLIGAGCKKSTTSRTTTGVAAYTPGGAPGTCTGFTTAGTYVVGAALTSANTVSLQVNVTTAGTYSVSSTSANGVSFTATGTFSSTGAQT